MGEIVDFWEEMPKRLLSVLPELALLAEEIIGTAPQRLDLLPTLKDPRNGGFKMPPRRSQPPLDVRPHDRIFWLVFGILAEAEAAREMLPSCSRHEPCDEPDGCWDNCVKMLEEAVFPHN